MQLTRCAQNYPDRPVRIISDAAAGGAIDTNLRIIAEGLSQKWAWQVVIEGCLHSEPRKELSASLVPDIGGMAPVLRTQACSRLPGFCLDLHCLPFYVRVEDPTKVTRELVDPPAAEPP